MAARSPLSVASFAGSVCDAMAMAAGEGAAIIEGAGASRSANSNLVTLRRLSLDRNKTVQDLSCPNLGFLHLISPEYSQFLHHLA